MLVLFDKDFTKLLPKKWSRSNEMNGDIFKVSAKTTRYKEEPKEILELKKQVIKI